MGAEEQATVPGEAQFSADALVRTVFLSAGISVVLALAASIVIGVLAPLTSSPSVSLAPRIEEAMVLVFLCLFVMCVSVPYVWLRLLLAVLLRPLELGHLYAFLLYVVPIVILTALLVLSSRHAGSRRLARGTHAAIVLYWMLLTTGAIWMVMNLHSQVRALLP